MNLKEHSLRAGSDTRKSLTSLGRRAPIWRVSRLGVQGTCSEVSVGLGEGEQEMTLTRLDRSGIASLSLAITTLIPL